MPTVISVIGPDHDRVNGVADQLRQLEPTWQVLVGAGPDANPSAVLAVVDVWDEPAREVVSAVASGQGSVLVLSSYDAQPSPSQESHFLPGGTFVSDVEEVPAAVRSCSVDMREWSSQAYRADAERIDRVKIAIRLGANRAVQRVCGEGGAGLRSQDDWDRAYYEFVNDLRVETLRHGVAFPSVSMEPPAYPDVPTTIAPQDIAIAVAATFGVLAAGIALGRALGQPLIGVLLGLVLAVAVACVRLRMMHQQHSRVAAQYRATELKKHLSALTTEMSARLNINRVAPIIK